MSLSNPPESPSPAGSPAAKPAKEPQPWIWRACLFAAALAALISIGPILVYPMFIHFFAFPVFCYVGIVTCMFLAAPHMWAARFAVIMGVFVLGLMAVAAALPVINVSEILVAFLGEHASRNVKSLAFMQVVLIGSGYAIRWKAPAALGWLVLLVTILVAIPQAITLASAARGSYEVVNELNRRQAGN